MEHLGTDLQLSLISPKAKLAQAAQAEKKYKEDSKHLFYQEQQT